MHPNFGGSTCSIQVNTLYYINLCLIRYCSYWWDHRICCFEKSGLEHCFHHWAQTLKEAALQEINLDEPHEQSQRMHIKCCSPGTQGESCENCGFRDEGIGPVTVNHSRSQEEVS